MYPYKCRTSEYWHWQMSICHRLDMSEIFSCTTELRIGIRSVQSVPRPYSELSICDK